MFAGILAGAAVISAASKSMIGPSLSVVHTRAVAPQKTRARAFFAAETEEPSNKSRRKPFETDRRFAKFAAQLVHHAVNHAAADQRFADRRRAPAMRTDA